MLTNDELRRVLEDRFVGSDELRELPIKTRGKRARVMACEALGYAVPKSFPRTQPRFGVEDFDIIVQQSNNYQPWNRDVRLSQRYVFVVLDSHQHVRSVHVVTGLDIANYPQTGTRTTKFQARFRGYNAGEVHAVVHGRDTPLLERFVSVHRHVRRATHVGVMPGSGLLTLAELGQELEKLIGLGLKNPGATQERLRGQALHESVCDILGYDRYADTGQHPDLPNQLLELKLQTSPTVDLGLVDPASEEPLPPPFPAPLRICDVRYAVFGATNTDNETTRINSVHMVAGVNFARVFERMGGLVQNSKLQIRLPREWFD